MWLEIAIATVCVALLIVYWWYAYWIRALVCPQCGQSATAAYKDAEKLSSEIVRAETAELSARGWHISGRPLPVVRFRCETCKIILEEMGHSLVVSQQQTFVTPDPGTAVQKLIDSIEQTIVNQESDRHQEPQ